MLCFASALWRPWLKTAGLRRRGRGSVNLDRTMSVESEVLEDEGPGRVMEGGKDREAAGVKEESWEGRVCKE
ncbi:hypothetical protein E2C01_072573 [Portunus trituberculatus]|uniref:Uncharacterized protein n=1 Tax=Portunus trituberculatus TaxID=210409 RepID=A0A5B7I7J5_PORTR|nr:hypothetical protein [Portunus trituberculatus]